MQCLESEFPFELTDMQRRAGEQLCDFLLSGDSSGAFVLRGYAGTGKTTLVAALVRVLSCLNRGVILLAPTGRAAKVFSLHAGKPAFTIHKMIYRQKNLTDEMSGFDLDFNKSVHTLFIVDESSMISNDGAERSFFGSGCLLDDLQKYVYSGEGCRILFVGDTAQLPPVGEEESPALSPAFLESMGLHVCQVTLTEVMRQAEESGILHNATHIRCLLSDAAVDEPPRIHLGNYKDIRCVPGSELIECLEESYDHEGMDETIVVTRSNKRATAYNNGIRASIFGREEVLCRGDMIMVVRNNYYWPVQAAKGLEKGEKMPMDFIANGDIAEVLAVHHYRELYGLHFADVSLRFPDYEDCEMDVRVILDVLQSDTPALPSRMSDELYHGVLEDYADIAGKRRRMEAVRQDPNYNALQIKYAYAVTCHKAQGGQWKHVFIDQGWLPPDGVDASYYRWLYTAFTRATQQLDLVNWPNEQCG